MALNAYLKLKGLKHGEIKGSVTQKGREGKIMVIAADHELLSPRDAASGLATGKRLHKPFVITKEIDAASPLLYAMLVSNETISDWELQFWTPQVKGSSGVGSEVQHYTVRLSDVHISDIHFRMLNNRNPELVRYAEHEEVSFTYGKIQWTWVAGGITAEDSWAAPLVARMPAAKAAAKPAPKAAAKASGKAARKTPPPVAAPTLFRRKR